MKIAKTITFEACHKLPDEECYGACRNLHGHSYTLKIVVEGSINKKGWVMNFKDLKAAMKKCVHNKYDHADLNEFFEIPTAEIMIKKIVEDIAEELFLQHNLISMAGRLWETATSYAEHTINFKK